MQWMWWAGAALTALGGVACGLNIGGRVARGEDRVWQPDVLGWVIGFHGLAGVAALAMVLAAKGVL